MDFKVGEVYLTPYGKLVVKERLAPRCRAVRLTIIAPSIEAYQMGWDVGKTVIAHPDDCVSPPVSTWELIDDARVA